MHNVQHVYGVFYCVVYADNCTKNAYPLTYCNPFALHILYAMSFDCEKDFIAVNYFFNQPINYGTK